VSDPWSPGAPAAGLGEVIRKQRELAELSMRRLAALAGISNPYLSQIERGLRVPSDEVVEAIAESLRLPADLLRGASDDPPGATAVLDAIAADPDLTTAQRRSLIEVYQAFRQVTVRRRRARGRRTA
jgi:transcriptional regulator with XRE-family HTH domain